MTEEFDVNASYAKLDDLFRNLGTPDHVLKLANALLAHTRGGGPLPDAWTTTREHFVDSLEETVSLATISGGVDDGGPIRPVSLDQLTRIENSPAFQLFNELREQGKSKEEAADAVDQMAILRAAADKTRMN